MKEGSSDQEGGFSCDYNQFLKIVIIIKCTMANNQKKSRLSVRCKNNTRSKKQ